MPPFVPPITPRRSPSDLATGPFRDARRLIAPACCILCYATFEPLQKAQKGPVFRLLAYFFMATEDLSALLRFLVSSERRRVLRRSHPNAVAPSPNRELPGTNGGATIRLKDASSSHAIILATFGTEWEERYNG
jgi:hypothetical protein